MRFGSPAIGRKQHYATSPFVKTQEIFPKIRQTQMPSDKLGLTNSDVTKVSILHKPPLAAGAADCFLKRQ